MPARNLLNPHIVMRPATEADAAKVRRNCEPRGNCLVWTGGISVATGYGSVRCEDGKNRRVHRVIWESVNGLPERDHHVTHKCSENACCRIEHLKLETAKERAERARRSRLSKEQAIAMAMAPKHRKNQRLSEEVIHGIFDDTCDGLSVRKTARKYDCNPATVMAIKNGTAWNHITNHHYDPELNNKPYSRGKLPIHSITSIARDKRTMREIAEQYGVTAATIHKIKHGHLYADITLIPPGGEYDQSRFD
jgi:transposase-like protein